MKIDLFVYAYSLTGDTVTLKLRVLIHFIEDNEE